MNSHLICKPFAAHSVSRLADDFMTDANLSTSATGHAPTPLDTAETDRSPATTGPVWRSETLMQGHRTITIEHQGVLYQLRATRLGKLILTK